MSTDKKNRDSLETTGTVWLLDHTLRSIENGGVQSGNQSLAGSPDP
jgi:hypothetical protein